MVLLAGLLPNPDLSVATMGITFQFTSFIYMFSMALGGESVDKLIEAAAVHVM